MPGRRALQPGALHRVNNGGMAEWSMAAVLKTVVRQRTGGSNPSSSASLRKRHWRAPMPFCLLGAPPLMYPAAPGLSPSDRPPPFALVRSLPIFAVQIGTGGSPEGSAKPDGIPEEEGCAQTSTSLRRSRWCAHCQSLPFRPGPAVRLPAQVIRCNRRERNPGGRGIRIIFLLKIKWLF